MKPIPFMAPSLTDNEKSNLLDSIESTWIGGVGPYISRVEQGWAEICGAKECVTASNGTVALHLGLLALGVGPGDEVIVPALTYVATANAVRYTGAEPVFVDVDKKTWCMDPSKIEAAITRRTKGILPVHLLGHPADMDAINKIATLYNIWVLCDAAQAHMATYKQRTVGSLADIEVFSFHVGKVFTCGEGGAIVLNDSKLANWLRMVRGHGMDPERRFFHPMTAYNYRLTNMQASVLCAQLDRRSEIMQRRRVFFERYKEGLTGIPGIGFQPIASWANPCPWVFAITIDEDKFGISRNSIIQEFADQNVETRPFTYPLNSLPPFRELSDSRGVTFPITEHLSKTGIYLPSSTDITEHEVDFICGIIKDLAKKGNSG